MADANASERSPVRLGPFVTQFLITILLTLLPFDLNASLVPFMFPLRWPATVPVTFNLLLSVLDITLVRLQAYNTLVTL